MQLQIEQEVIERIVVTYPLNTVGLDGALTFCEEQGYQVVRTGPKRLADGQSRSEGTLVAERAMPEATRALEAVESYTILEEE